MIDEGECEPEGGEVGEEVGALQADVVLDCVFDYERVVGCRDRESFIGVWEDERGKTLGEEGACIVDRYNHDGDSGVEGAGYVVGVEARDWVGGAGGAVCLDSCG